MEPISFIEIDSKQDLEILKTIINKKTINKLNLVEPKHVRKVYLTEVKKNFFLDPINRKKKFYKIKYH